MSFIIEMSKSKNAACHECGQYIEDPVRLYWTVDVSKKGQYRSNKDCYHIKCTRLTLEKIKLLHGWESLLAPLKGWVEALFR